MPQLVIGDELITTHGALSVYHASIDELSRRYGGSDEDKHLHVEELMAPTGTFLVARLDDHPVGGVGIRPIGDPAHDIGEVKRLWVRPDLRRAGIGLQLMDRAEVRAKELGFRQLYLESGYAQPEALELYRNSGWREVDNYPPGAYSYPKANRFMKDL
ncbi:MAG TPA: GNAT family N-acetyltransferase [Acidimicrobiales bacterium]